MTDKIVVVKGYKVYHDKQYYNIKEILYPFVTLDITKFTLNNLQYPCFIAVRHDDPDKYSFFITFEYMEQYDNAPLSISKVTIMTDNDINILNKFKEFFKNRKCRISEKCNIYYISSCPYNYNKAYYMKSDFNV